jgi:glycosyltransferase involved in cell wall biosynthesis
MGQIKNTAIVIVVYNTDKFIKKQIELIKRFCQDKFDIIIVDNSTIPSVINSILHIVSKTDCIYVKTNASSQWGSDSHSFAANFAYSKFKDEYAYFFYLDHDCFPIKPFSVVEVLKDYCIAGIGQAKSKTYMWPGCLMFIPDEDINFSPSHEFGLDTGGMLYKILEKSPNSVLHFKEVHEQNPEFTKSMYNFYATINNGMFMHFINGSGWNKANANEERLNSLLNILEKKCAAQ